MKVGERRVSARRGWAGDNDAFLSILTVTVPSVFTGRDICS